MRPVLVPADGADAIIRDIVRLGEPYGVEVRGMVRSVRSPQEAVLHQFKLGNYNLLVMI